VGGGAVARNQRLLQRADLNALHRHGVLHMAPEPTELRYISALTTHLRLQAPVALGKMQHQFGFVVGAENCRHGSRTVLPGDECLAHEQIKNPIRGRRRLRVQEREIPGRHVSARSQRDRGNTRFIASRFRPRSTVLQREGNRFGPQGGLHITFFPSSGCASTFLPAGAIRLNCESEPDWRGFPECLRDFPFHGRLPFHRAPCTFFRILDSTRQFRVPGHNRVRPRGSRLNRQRSNVQGNLREGYDVGRCDWKFLQSSTTHLLGRQRNNLRSSVLASEGHGNRTARKTENLLAHSFVQNTDPAFRARSDPTGTEEGSEGQRMDGPSEKDRS